MQIQTIDSFLTYWQRLRARTRRVVDHIPPEHIEWTYREGRFTLGDLVRHLAALEREMFAENVCGRPSRYAGHGRERAEGKEAVIAFLERMDEETVELLSALPDEHLSEHCETPGGARLRVWKWLRAMAEHEIHHRGQIYLYLSLLGVTTPPLFGLTAEEVEERSTGAAEDLP
jgi:uncharacterized damage-inducible protein DinB